MPKMEIKRIIKVLWLMVLVSSCSNNSYTEKSCIWSLERDITYFANASPGTMIDWSISMVGGYVNSSKVFSNDISFLEGIVSQSPRWLLMQDTHVESGEYRSILLSDNRNGKWKLFELSIGDNEPSGSLRSSVVSESIIDLGIFDFEANIDLTQYELGLRDGSVAYLSRCLDGRLTRSAVYGVHEGFHPSDFPDVIDSSAFTRLADVVMAVERAKRLSRMTAKTM